MGIRGGNATKVSKPAVKIAAKPQPMGVVGRSGITKEFLIKEVPIEPKRKTTSLWEKLKNLSKISDIYIPLTSGDSFCSCGIIAFNDVSESFNKIINNSDIEHLPNKEEIALFLMFGTILNTINPSKLSMDYLLIINIVSPSDIDNENGGLALISLTEKTDPVLWNFCLENSDSNSSLVKNPNTKNNIVGIFFSHASLITALERLEKKLRSVEV